MNEMSTPERKAWKDVDRQRRYAEQQGWPDSQGGWEKLFEERVQYHYYHDVVLAGLPNRARNMVYRVCFPKTKEQIRQEVMSGALDFTKRPNCGKKTVAGIFKWLGLLLKGQKSVTCPCCQAHLVYSKGKLFQFDV